MSLCLYPEGPLDSVTNTNAVCTTAARAGVRESTATDTLVDEKDAMISCTVGITTYGTNHPVYAKIIGCRLVAFLDARISACHG